MSITFKPKKEDGSREAVFTNGDIKLIEAVMEKWKFKDEEKMLRFMLSLLKENEDAEAIGYKKDGQLMAVSPADDLIDKTDER